MAEQRLLREVDRQIHIRGLYGWQQALDRVEHGLARQGMDRKVI